MLDNQVALVTGASRGIGQAIALLLGKNGATVIGTATTESGAEKISATLSENGIKGAGRCFNDTDPEGVSTVISEIQTSFAPISILINNAGITRDNLLMRMKEDEWDQVLDTNLSSVFRVSKACVRGMVKKRYGRIISIASVVGASGNPGQANYAAAKAGMMGFSRALAREVGIRGITVNTVAPGFIDTDMTRAMSDDQRQALQGQIPANRLGSAEEIAEAVVFLASPGAAYITGQTLHVNGGMYMT